MKQLTASVVLAFAVAAVAPSHVSAHGSVELPVSRQLKCYIDGGYHWPADGSGIPSGGCREAYRQGGNSPFPFQQWHENSINIADYRNMHAVRSAIPDGTLCAAGSWEKRGLDASSSEWFRSSAVVVDGRLTVRYKVTAPHAPSYFEFYVTRRGHNPTAPLRWSDLDLIHTADVPGITNESGGRYYVMDVPVAADRNDDATLFVRWQRIDPVGEGFYSCSDVRFVQAR